MRARTALVQGKQLKLKLVLPVEGTGNVQSRPNRQTRAPRLGSSARPDLSDGASRLLRERLRPGLDRSLDLTLTDNHSTMVYVRRRPGALQARIHHMFVDAPPPVVRSLARYLESADRESSVALGHFINANQRRIRGPLHERPPVSCTLRTLGEFFDLAEIFDFLNGRYFAGKVDARITWGPRTRRSYAQRVHRRSIKMGSYSVEDRLIRVHPSLDAPFVPRYVVAAVVYHEMLHQIHDIPRVNGRRRFHTPAFVKDERRFTDFERAHRWELRNIDRLLAA
ncbi:MAG: hypothetical protein AABZ30_10680 [Myxococcota bacterium]